MVKNVKMSESIFKAPFTCIVSGASCSGKTTFVERILNNREVLINPPPSKVLYCYGELTPKIIEWKHKGIEPYYGFPSEEEIKVRTPNLLLILDDLLTDLEENVKLVNKLFTRGSHHWNFSVILITQNIYDKNLRLLRLNSHYLVLLRNPQGQDQIRTLSHQMYPSKRNFFLESFADATIKHFSYLFIDVHPSTSDNQRLSTNIFPEEKRVFYIPKI